MDAPPHAQDDELLKSQPPDASWLRQPGEPMLWYSRFQEYLHMGPSRSLLGAFIAEKAVKSPKKPDVPGAWKAAAAQWNWDERADEFDTWVLKQLADRWQKRYKQYREKEYTVLMSLLDKMEKMLEFPVATITRDQLVDDGKTIIRTVVNPAKWSVRDIASMLSAMSGIAESFTTTFIKSEDQEQRPVKINMESLPPELLVNIAKEKKE